MKPDLGRGAPRRSGAARARIIGSGASARACVAVAGGGAIAR